MNRTAFTGIALCSCATAAWIGWKIAQPASRVEPGIAPKSAAKPRVPSASRVKYDSIAAADFQARGDRSLTDILTTLERMRLDPGSQATVDESVSGELMSLLYSLQESEIPGVLQHFASLPPPPPDRLLAAVLGRWAEFDGAAAMAWAQKLTPSRQDLMRGAILSGWAKQDGAAAWAWYKAAWEAAPEPRYRLERDFTTMIHAWAMRDAPAALAACLSEGSHGTYNAWAGFGSVAALPERRDEIMRLIAGIADEKARASASRGALLAWSASAPADAAAWVDENLPGADSNLLWSVAERFGRANPRANADWLLRRTPPEKRDEAYQLCLYQWADASPAEAAAWLETTGVTDQSAEIIAGAFARRDVDTAVHWAARVSQAGRAQAVANALAQARTHGKQVDASRHAAAAGISAEALEKLVAETTERFGSRL